MGYKSAKIGIGAQFAENFRDSLRQAIIAQYVVATRIRERQGRA